MFKAKTEFIVGIFVIVGIVALVYLSVTLGDIRLFGDKNYSVFATFDSVTGLKVGAKVEVAGVEVGKVSGIKLDEDQAVVEMDIHKDVMIADDSVASIRTQGIIGDKYVKLSLGGSDEYIENEGAIFDTESAISLEELISKYIFESK
jgi:phospholipid/cholesterol/gamma-HCH transport system substrate-binding protein